MPLKLTFHESQYPEQLALLCQSALRARKLPGRLLYDSPAQAQRWLAYHQKYSPSRAEPELLTLYERAFTAAALSASPESPLHYVSLGCGGGNKDALFVRSALNLGKVLHVTPMDTSPALVLETMLRLEETFPPLAASPLVIDLAAEPDIGPWLARQENAGACRIFGCFGIIPNFDYVALLSYLKRLMRRGDLLLLSANLSPALATRRHRASCHSTITHWPTPGLPACWTAWGFRRRACDCRLPPDRCVKTVTSGVSRQTPCF